DVTPSDTVQAVPDAADRLDPVALGPELGPEVVDVGVDGIGRDGDPERPRLVQQLVAAEGLAGVAKQRFEQRELAGTEITWPTMDRDRARRLVEADRAGDEPWLGPAGGALGPAGEGPQTRGELVVAERLHDVVVGAGVETAHAIADRVAGGEHEDRLL